MSKRHAHVHRERETGQKRTRKEVFLLSFFPPVSSTRARNNVPWRHTRSPTTRSPNAVCSQNIHCKVDFTQEAYKCLPARRQSRGHANEDRYEWDCIKESAGTMMFNTNDSLMKLSTKITCSFPHIHVSHPSCNNTPNASHLAAENSRRRLCRTRTDRSNHKYVLCGS